MKAKPSILELDFGMGNIRSLEKAFEHHGADIRVSDRADDIKKADVLVLPGDGAFSKAMEEIRARGFLEPICEHVKKGKPLLGICIGFQILYEESEEFGNHKGLGFLPGKVERFPDSAGVVPHMGWSDVHMLKRDDFVKDLPEKTWFYFVHSYRVPTINEYTLASCDYAGEFTAIVRKENIIGTQFHPEKSQDMGLHLIDNFLEMIA